MGGKIGFLIGIVSSVFLYLSESMILFWISVTVTIVIFWSWGVMHNYAMGLAKRRFDQLKRNKIEEGASLDEIRRLEQIKIRPSLREVESVPNSITQVNMIATLVAVILLITSLIIFFYVKALDPSWPRWRKSSCAGQSVRETCALPTNAKWLLHCGRILVENGSEGFVAAAIRPSKR